MLERIAGWFGWIRVRVIDKVDATGPDSFRPTAWHYEWKRLRARR